MEKYSLDLKVLGNKDDILNLLRFLGSVQYCCNIGASRDLKLAVDGDGSADVRFQVKWGGTDNFKDLESTKFKDVPDTFYLGE